MADQKPGGKLGACKDTGEVQVGFSKNVRDGWIGWTRHTAHVPASLTSHVRFAFDDRCSWAMLQVPSASRGLLAHTTSRHGRPSSSCHAAGPQSGRGVRRILAPCVPPQGTLEQQPRKGRFLPSSPKEAQFESKCRSADSTARNGSGCGRGCARRAYTELGHCQTMSQEGRAAISTPSTLGLGGEAVSSF